MNSIHEDNMKHSFGIIVIFLIFFNAPQLLAQKFKANGGVLVKAEITLGNQNQWLKVGVSGLGTLSYGDIALESGLSLASYAFLKRHTLKTEGFAYYYEFFGLAGVGKNSNLLGATVFNTNTALLFNPLGKGGFNGLGFGVSKEVLPNNLKSYGLKRGALLMRFSNANHNFHFAFRNDLKIGLFNGAGTDYGVTGSLDLGFTKIKGPETIYQLGFGIDLFTPRPDYSRSPRNPINSDNGRKNVWYTLPPIVDLFYGNVYVYGTYQEEYVSVHSKIGLNSQKTGAYIQNTLHDGLGLNPRFPWQVETKNKLYIEISGNVLKKEVSNE
ncbi:hypothetical protein [Aquimarina aggregata]|nr:hypothetical protein [Aquimarina aggregata]